MKLSVNKYMPALTLALLSGTFDVHADVITEQSIGDVFWVAGSNCPGNTRVADGKLLPIAQYESLYSIIGTQFGSDGDQGFYLPDLRSRNIVGFGSNANTGKYYAIGQQGGADSYTLTANDITPHTHGAVDIDIAVQITGDAASSTTPVGYLATSNDNHFVAELTDSTTVTMTDDAIASRVQALSVTHVDGGGKPWSLRSPYVAMTPCIVTHGNFPERPE